LGNTARAPDPILQRPSHSALKKLTHLPEGTRKCVISHDARILILENAAPDPCTIKYAFSVKNRPPHNGLFDLSTSSLLFDVQGY
jgi:hypothetical protein